RQPDPAAAVTLLNEFLWPRRDGSTFVSLWLGLFDIPARQLRYVDAGHGYAMMQHADGTFVALDRGENLFVGATGSMQYQVETTTLPPSARVFAVSDGIIEQSPANSPSSTEFFGVSRL